MPTYLYRRDDGTTFEVVQKITDKLLAECPETGRPVERIIVSSTFRLKGKGWASDNYSS